MPSTPRDPAPATRRATPEEAGVSRSLPERTGCHSQPLRHSTRGSWPRRPLALEEAGPPGGYAAAQARGQDDARADAAAHPVLQLRPPFHDAAPRGPRAVLSRPRPRKHRRHRRGPPAAGSVAPPEDRRGRVLLAPHRRHGLVVACRHAEVQGLADRAEGAGAPARRSCGPSAWTGSVRWTSTTACCAAAARMLDRSRVRARTGTPSLDSFYARDVQELFGVRAMRRLPRPAAPGPASERRARRLLGAGEGMRPQSPHR